MSSTNTTVDMSAVQLRDAMITFSKVWSSILFALGIVGHTLSIYVFTRRTLRSNPCARYFLACAISGYFIVFGTIPLRFLQLSYNIDIFTGSLITCKLVSYILVCVRVIPTWFIALACADRFFCSSQSFSLRKLSSLRVANIAIPSVFVLIFLMYVHLPIYYTILPSRTCFPVAGTYQSYLSIWHLIVWSWIPSTIMVICGLLTVRNVRIGKKRIAPQNNQNTTRNGQKRIDRQLIQMILVQSLSFATTTTSYSFVNLYISYTAKPGDDAMKAAINAFLSNLFAYIALTGPCTSFYFFTLSSKLFRQELMQIFSCLQKSSTNEMSATHNTVQ